MENKIYSALFHREDNKYWVEFPDLPGCLTEGKTIEEAYKKAGEALALYLDGLESAPNATEIEKIKKEKNDIVMLIEAKELNNIVYYKKTDIPNLIEKGLEKKGFSKYQASQILGVDRSYLTKIVQGNRAPSVDMAKRIGTLLDFDWKVFYAD